LYEPSQKEITDLGELKSVWDLDARVEWLIQDMLPLRSVNLLTADSGTGKTWVSYAIAGAVAHGRSFIGLKTEKRPVLYLDGENPLAIAKRNLELLGIGRTDALKVWGGWNDTPPPGPDSPIVREFAAKNPLMIWDSLVEFHPGDEQSSTETRKFMKLYRSLAHLGATILILHHVGKSGKSPYRGSSDIKAAVDTAYHVEGVPRDGRIHRLTLENFKSRFAPVPNFALEFESGRGFTGVGAPTISRTHSTAEVVEELVRANSGLNGTQIKKLAKERGLSKHAVDECLMTGQFNRQKGRGSAILYTMVDEVPVAEALVEDDFPSSPVLETETQEVPTTPFPHTSLPR
jgi:hypothetical protein